MVNVLEQEGPVTALTGKPLRKRAGEGHPQVGESECRSSGQRSRSWGGVGEQGAPLQLEGPGAVLQMVSPELGSTVPRATARAGGRPG